MRKSFKNPDRVEVIFTEEGVTFYGAQQDVHFPYGCLDTVRLSLLGVLQVVSKSSVACFAVNRADRAEMKKMVAYARNAMKTAPKASVEVVDLSQEAQVSGELPPEEQLKQYKALFIQGAISKQEYDLRKRQLKAE